MPSQLDVDKIRHTNGTDALTFDTSGNTNLKSAVIEGSSSGNLVRITQTGTGNALVVEDSANPDATPFVVDANGHVGIGASPQSNLDVASATGGTLTLKSTDTTISTANEVIGQIQFYTSDTSSGNTGVFAKIDAVSNRLFDGDNASGMNLRFFTGDKGDGAGNPPERMRIDSSGNVGIGTNSPSEKLTVSGDIYAVESVDRGVLLTASGSIEIIRTDGDPFIDFKTSLSEDYDIRIQQVDNGLTFQTGGNGSASERMRIDSSGRIGIGRSTVSTIGVVIQRGETYLMVMRNSSGYDQVLIESDGDIRNTNNSYGALSDIKLKENITDANNQWNDIKNLRVVNFNFTEASGYSQHRQIGFIAQEVELVSPGLVSESIDRDEEGNELGTVTKSVRSSIIFIKAVKALQEAMDRIESQQSQIDTLTAKTQEQDLTIASLISRIEALETN